MKHFLRATVLLLWAFVPLLRAQPAPNNLSVGMNIAGPADYGSEWPFVNVMSFARSWGFQNSVWIDGGSNPWDTPEYADSVAWLPDGYPPRVPLHFASAETSQVVFTVWANTSSMPGGDYLLLYDGSGSIDFRFDARVDSSAPGRLVVDVDPANGDNIMQMTILHSDSADPVRNIRFLMPGSEPTHASEPFEAEWLDRLAPFGTIRFMDWGITNNSALSNWAERPRIEDYSYTPHGVPYEWMLRLCNLTEKDMWLCVPHRADSTYISNLATLVRDSLDADRRVYVEYSNEIWNWIFSQTHYLHDNGDPDVPWPERIVPWVQNCLDIFTEVFSETGELDRLTRVVGVQGGYYDVSQRLASNLRPGSFDAVSPAAYFHFAGDAYQVLSDSGASATGELVLELATEGIRDEAAASLRGIKGLADQLDVDLLYYEGGQHLTPDPFGSVQPYGPALVEAQTLPGMYDLYHEWMDSLQSIAGQDSSLLMHFSFISPPSGRYGSWGALQSLHDLPPYEISAPKYQVLLDIAGEQNQSAGSDLTLLPDKLQLLPPQPNPFNPATTVLFQLSRPQTIRLRVHDLLGREVALLAQGHRAAGSHRVRFDGSGLASGLYFVRLEAGGLTVTRKALLLK